MSNVVFLRRFMVLLELLAGLKINHSKCSIMGVNVDEGSMADYSQVLGCKSSRIPFEYLGVNTGCSHRRISDWTYLMDRIRGRIGKWNANIISIGGRLVLVFSK